MKNDFISKLAIKHKASKKVRLEKLDDKHKKQFWILIFLFFIEKIVLSQNFYSSKFLRATKSLKDIYFLSKSLFNHEINNKQKAVKSLQQKFIEVKNSLNYKMSYTDYVHVCNTFLDYNNKKISEVKETKDKNYATLFLEVGS